MKTHKKIKHGYRYHRLYKIWLGMMQRCYSTNSINYSTYGLKGVKVYEQWHKIENFINDMYPTFMEGLTLDRRDTNGNYEPSNCRWVSRATQSRNRKVIQKNNTSGFKGVCLSRSKIYVSQIKVNSKRIYLGSFKTAIEAAEVYDKYIIDNNLEHTKNF